MMQTVEVLIERDFAGRLHGHVILRRDGLIVEKGSDMLAHRVYRQVDSAVVECDRQVLKLCRPYTDHMPRIEYIVSGSPRVELPRPEQPVNGELFDAS